MRKRGFIWFLVALCVVCLAEITHLQCLDITPEQGSYEQTVSSIVTQQHNQRHEATLTDSTLLYRICSSRPQRTLHTQGSRSERLLTPVFNSVWRYIVKPLHSYFDSRCRMESAPFCMSSSYYYYIIALRHIIR